MRPCAALSGLLVAGGLHVLTAHTYGRLGLHPAVREGESQILRATFGPLVATVLPLCARVIYTVSAATGILAIAGYVFNEVFVYWFPNLGFSFCLLGMVVGLNLGGVACGHAGATQLRGTCPGRRARLGGPGSGAGADSAKVRGHVVLLRDRAESAGGPAASWGLS